MQKRVGPMLNITRGEFTLDTKSTRLLALSSPSNPQNLDVNEGGQEAVKGAPLLEGTCPVFLKGEGVMNGTSPTRIRQGFNSHSSSWKIEKSMLSSIRGG